MPPSDWLAGLTFGLMLGTRMELTPPSFTLILRQRLDSVCGEVLFTFFACTIVCVRKVLKKDKRVV